MAVMHLPNDHLAGWPHEPQQQTAIESLRELRERVETGKQRAEIIEGRLIVSPMPVCWPRPAASSPAP